MRIAASAAALAAIAAVGLLAGTALSSPAERADDPLGTQTFTDPAGDAPSGAPDITAVTVSNFADGTISFKVKLPNNQGLNFNSGVGVYIDSDANRATGQFGDDYFIAVIGGTNPSYQLQQWSNATLTWLPVGSPTLRGQFQPNDGPTVTIAKSELGIGSTINFDVWSSVPGGGGVVYSDEAPDQPNFFSFTLGTPAATTTTAPPTTTTSVSHLNGRVGPGATITLARAATAGAAVVTIADRTASDDFHLSGPGVNKRTGIPFKGTVTWRVTLRKGTYTFRSDAHASLHGTLKVS